MRRDSLPYSNVSAPRPYNIKYDSSSNILEFDVNTRGRELDLNRIIVVHLLDSIVIDFDERINSDNQFYGGNEDGYQETFTAQGYAVIIWIYPYPFPTLNNFQRIFFAFQPPSFWNHNFTELFVRDTQGNQTHVWTSVKERLENSRSTDFVLFPNFPNPFNPSTTIRFAVPQKSSVSLAIYDARGSLVRELSSDKLYEPGWVEVTWDGRNDAGLPVSSGVYFYRMHAQGLHDKRSFTQSRKLTLLK